MTLFTMSPDPTTSPAPTTFTDPTTFTGSTTFTNWRKSRRSEPNGACVEVGRGNDGSVGVRDSTSPTGPVLAFGPREWAAFLTRALTGGLDLP